MNERLRSVFRGTRKVLATKWSPTDLNVPPWVINAVIYITMIRSIAYGLELFLIVNNPVSPLMAFAAIFGIQTWGILMLIGVAILLVGLIFRNSMFVTFGALFCAAVWLGFGVTLGIGAFSLNTGWRFFVAALATSATWIIFFTVQLRAVRLRAARS